MKLRSLLLSALVACVIALPASAKDEAPTVKISTGILRGADVGAVTQYLGIPYAKPPVGDLRWRDPVVAPAWKGVRDATAFGASCYQDKPDLWGPFSPEFLELGPKISEDCLYLNVWTPKGPHKKLPVFFWIHGGGFGSGSTYIPIYNGKNLADKGVVVVTINYRLGIFGFLAHPELTKESKLHSSGNYGLLDMAEALKWVKKNIAAFGGDPNDITIGGQSAGAAAVNDLILSPAAKGLFQRAAAFSGSGGGFPIATLADAEKIGTDLAAKLHAKTAADLRAVSAERLMQATVVAPPKPGSKAMPHIVFAPNVDGSVLAGNPGDPSTPVVTNAPLLTGFTHEDMFLSIEPVTPEGFEKKVREKYGSWADKFLAAYPHATVEQATKSDGDLARDRTAMNMTLWAAARSRNAGEAIYTYMFNHPYPLLNREKYGTFHTADVPYIFGALELSPKKASQADWDVSRQIQSYLINFMKTGNLVGEGLIPWASDPANFRLMNLGDHVGGALAVSSPECLELFKAYVASGGKLGMF